MQETTDKCRRANEQAMSEARREWNMRYQMQANDHANTVNMLRAQAASLESQLRDGTVMDELVNRVHTQAVTIATITESRDHALKQMIAHGEKVRRLEQDIASLSRHASDSKCVRACSVCFEPITTDTTLMLSKCHHETCCECMPTILGRGGSCPVCRVVSPDAITGYLSFMEKATVELVEPVTDNVQESRRRQQRWSMIVITGARFDTVDAVDRVDRVEKSLQLLQIPPPRSHPRMCAIDDKFNAGRHCVKMFYNEDEAECVCAKLVDLKARIRKDILAGKPDPAPWLSSCDIVKIAGH